ncbi:MAG: tRNA (adenosine(37)-N6)-threonylcarbamoyltransferase complex dimerization subunit type 1 TsaB [Actinobacteria bacterium]|nr:tRNA (adenosine(37)-N6)-threonylcarbamoyltransferase complex dimerization subunit type 1 TsaB [Actinomycetota bacterium]
MHILGIDSSTTEMSIAVSRAGQNNAGFADKTVHIEYKAQERFMTQIIPLIDSVLKKTGIEIKSLDYYCVNRGPGDFTATRIGLSVIKTLAMIFKKPVYAIECGEVLTQQAAFLNAEKISLKIKKGFRVFVVPVIDVKRKEVFFSLYDVSINEKAHCTGKIIKAGNCFFTAKISGDILCSSADFISKLQEFFNAAYKKGFLNEKHALFFCGSAFEAYKHLIKDIKWAKNSLLFPGQVFYPQAEYLNQCALYRIAKKQKGDENIKPYYVRDFAPFKKT